MLCFYFLILLSIVCLTNPGPETTSIFVIHLYHKIKLMHDQSHGRHRVTDELCCCFSFIKENVFTVSDRFSNDLWARCDWRIIWIMSRWFSLFFFFFFDIRWFSHNSFSNDYERDVKRKRVGDQQYYSNSQDNYNLVTPSVGRQY